MQSDSSGVYYAPPVRRADGKWHITRYADVAFALRDPRLSAARAATWQARAPHPLWLAFRRWTRAEGAVADLRGHWLALNDPPEHTRLRSIIQPLWTRHIQRAHGHLAASVQDSVARLQNAGTVELNAALNAPLSLRLTMELLGLPPNPPADVTDSLLNAKALFGVNPDAPAREFAQAKQLIGYVARAIALKKKEPAEDLISELVTAQANGASLDDAELTALVLLLLITSYRTPFYFFGGAIELLLQQPEAFERFRSSKGETALAIEELLRVTSSADSTERVIKTDMELGGVPFARGETLYLNLLAANHDPTRFASPEQCNWTRAPNPHLSFGAGAHICLGAGLARLEAQLVFGALTQMTPHMQLLYARARSNHMSHRYKPAELWVKV